MSSKNLEYSEISLRVLELADYYKKHKGMSNKDFLELCSVNRSLISSIKSGHIQNPNSEIIQRIVKNTGCSGTWILGGDAEMFEPRQKPAQPIAAEPGVEYAAKLLEEIEKGGELKSEKLPLDFPLQVAKLLVKLLEAKYGG